MRRMSGRTPPFAITGFVVICCFLSYNLWTLSSHNDDLANELEKIQIEIKLCGTKQIESDKSASLLQGNINELQSKLTDSRKNTELDRSQLKTIGNELVYAKDQQKKMYKIEEELKQELETKEAKNIEVGKKLEQAIEMKSDAEIIIAEKDQLVNKLQQQLEQAKRDLHIAFAQGKEEQGTPLKHYNAKKKKPYTAKGSLSDVLLKSVNTNSRAMSGFIVHPGVEMLPREPPDVVRNKPKVNEKDVTHKPDKELSNQVQIPHVEQGDVYQLGNAQNVIHNPEAVKHELDLNKINGPHQQQVIQKPLLLPEDTVQEHISAVLNMPPKAAHRMMHRSNQVSNGLPLPLQKLAENPDTAIDEVEKIVEDPADDQDEEGKEIKGAVEALPGDDDKNNFQHFNNNIDYEEDNERNGLQKNVIPKGENPDPRGIGIMGFPRAKDAAAGEDYVNFGGDTDHNDVKPNDRLYETNFSNKIRNIGKM